MRHASTLAKTLAASAAALAMTAALAGHDDPDERDRHSDRQDDPESHHSLLHPMQGERFGRSLREWSAEWSQYVFSFPLSTNPLLDQTGASCTPGQHGPVWFLVGTIGTPDTKPVVRSCTIPAGKALFFPLINLVDINTATPPQPVRELRAEIDGCFDRDRVSDLVLQIDGQAVPQAVLRRWRVRSVPFEVATPPDGLLPAGVYSPAVADGYYALVRPLPPGQHTLRFAGRTAGCSYGPTNFAVSAFSVDVTYHLTVKPVSSR